MAEYRREGSRDDARDFLGRGWKFPLQVDETTGRIKTVSYEDDIAEAIYIILFTRKGERAMRPEFGSTIYEYIFSSMDYTTIKRMERELTDALIQWEPRIVDPEVTVDTRDADKGAVHIRVEYIVRTTNNPYNLVFPYYISEGL